MKVHIIGLTKKSLQTYKFLRKKKFKITVSDIKPKNKFQKILNSIKKSERKNFFFKHHPKKIINKSKKIVITDGVIQKYDEWIKYDKSKKFISELDLFQKYFKYDRNKCIIITGSFGKTTFAKLLKKELTKIGFKKNIIIAGRKNVPLFSLKENLNNFLIIEADYQNLSILKNSNFKYVLILNLNIKGSNKKSHNKFYVKSKLNLIKKHNTKGNIFLSKYLFLKNKPSIKKKLLNLYFFERKKNIQIQNKSILSSIISKFKEDKLVKLR